MAGNFNISNSDWDLSFLHHSIHTSDLLIIANSFDLDLSTPINPGPTRFADNNNGSNSVIDLMFINPLNSGFNNHQILQDKRLPSDHVPLFIELQITPANIEEKRRSIKSGSDEEVNYHLFIISQFANLPDYTLSAVNELEDFTNKISSIFDEVWVCFSKEIRVTKRSKEWWNHNCTNFLKAYRTSDQLEDWKAFKCTIKSTKQTFFEEKIQEIASSNKRPWNLMNWIKHKNLPTAEAISFNNQACISLDLLWQALHLSYNSANNRPINPNILEEVDISPHVEWPPLTQYKFIEAIAKCSNSSTSSPDHVSWSTLKLLVRDKKGLSHIIWLANACINLSYWPSHFKESTSVIIPKLQKLSYDLPKAFRPIVLLNTLGKLIEKVIGHRIQHHAVANNFIHPNQLGGIHQRSTADAGTYLTHIIHAGWIKGLQTSVVTFDITQFFPLLNHDFLSACITKAGFDN